VSVEGIRLSSHRRDGFVVIAVSGELDIVTSRRFDEFLARARQDNDHIVIDLSAVDFMDTGSLAVIVGHWKQVTAAGGTLALAGARYRYTKTLWITGLADRLPLYDSVADAVAAGPPAAGAPAAGGGAGPGTSPGAASPAGAGAVAEPGSAEAIGS
jgi:anti-anti-sigma factor